jgi:hypothetical protein
MSGSDRTTDRIALAAWWTAAPGAVTALASRAAPSASTHPTTDATTAIESVSTHAGHTRTT